MASKFDLGSLVAREVAAPAGERTIEAITGEILEAKRTGGEAILTIGQRLIEAKELLAHGEWLPWLEEQVEFSERTARNFMRLAREWTNRQALADLGAAKALTLLALPAEEREAFMAAPHAVDGEERTVIDMTTRELERAIREREEAKAEQSSAEAARDKMAQDLDMANKLLASAMEEKEQASAAAAALEKELRELKAAPVDVAVMEVDKQRLDDARAEARAEMEGKLERAKSAKAAAEEKRKEAEETVVQLKAQLAALQKAERSAAIAADKDMATFEVLFVEAQEVVNKMQGLLLKLRGREDSQRAEAVQRALRALAEAVSKAAE